mgnify:CR=1 FL=1
MTSTIRALGLLALLFSTLPARADTPLDALCGTTLTEDLVLTDDIDCTGYTGVALTIGADDITIDVADDEMTIDFADILGDRKRVRMRKIQVTRT